MQSVHVSNSLFQLSVSTFFSSFGTYWVSYPVTLLCSAFVLAVFHFSQFTKNYIDECWKVKERITLQKFLVCDVHCDFVSCFSGCVFPCAVLLRPFAELGLEGWR